MSNSDPLVQMTDWAESLLSSGNLPESTANIETLVAQQAQENSQYPTNPLNIRNGPNGTITDYPDTQQGINAALGTIQQNDPAYYGALASNTTSNPAPDIAALSQSTWEGLPPGSPANQSYAGNVANDLTSIYGGGSLPSTFTTSSNTTGVTPSGNKLDFFTSSMVYLNGVMNQGGALPLEGILSRFMIATAFAGVGFLSIVSMVTGSKNPLPDVAGVAASFLAGPEAGIATAASKLGIRTRRPATNDETAQARLSLSQQRFAFSQQRESRLAEEKQQQRITQAIRQSSADQSKAIRDELASRRQQLSEEREARVKSEKEAGKTDRATALANAQRRTDIAKHRADTQRKAVLLRARQQRLVEKTLKGEDI